MSPVHYQVYNLEETYPELGRYSVKIVLNPKRHKSAHEFSVRMFDSDRKPMKHELQVWGRKLNVTFDITPEVADGVAFIEVLKGQTVLGRLTCWVIKP